MHIIVVVEKQLLQWLVTVFFFQSTAQLQYVLDGNEVNVTIGEQCKKVFI